MVILHSFEELHKLQCRLVYALGTFDGIHQGHRAIIHKGKELGKVYDASFIVVTFDGHPFSILKPHMVPPLLNQSDLKYVLLERMGVDYVLELPMNEELLQLDAKAFMERLMHHNDVKAIVVGSNFSFGKGGKGNGELIQALYPRVETVSMPLVRYPSIDAPISSTVIRKAIERGDIELGHELLGRPYSFKGTVIKGDQRGRTLGFPTLNFLFPKNMATPPDGVYVNRVYIDGRWYGGVGNMGDNPTFKNQYHRFEVHIFDFNEDVYGKEVIVQFLQFLRSEVRFDNLDALIKQMALDEEKARDYLASHPLSV